MILKLNKKNL